MAFRTNRATLNATTRPTELPSSWETPDEEVGYSPVYFQEGRAVIAVLVGFLYLLLAFSLDAAGWVENMTLLIPVTLMAVVLGTLMAFSRFDGFFMLSHSLSTGLAWVFFLMTRLVGEEPRVLAFVDHGVPALQARAYFLLERWLEWVQAALSGSASNDNYVFILEIGFLIWWLAYLGAWTVFRHGHVWRGVLLAGIAILVNTYYAPRPVIGLLVAFCVVSLILLAWSNLISHQQRWRFLRIRFSQDITFDFMRNGLLYAVAVIVLAFVTPNLGRNNQFNQLLAPINERWQEATTEWNRLYQGINRQTLPVRSTFGRTLTLGGERNVTPSPVLQIAATEGRYWRAVAFDTFTGRQWINTATEEAEFAANEPVASIYWAERRPLTHTITLLSSIGSVLLAPQDIVQVSVPIDGLLSPVLNPPVPQTPINSGELTWGRMQRALEVGESYSVVSSSTQVTERALREASTDYPQPIGERYLQLPDGFSAQTAALATEITQSQLTVYDRAKAVEEYLRTNYVYNEEIEAPSEDQDPVEYFLFNIRQGYCDYYATSMTVMLRSLGIPARTASGYAEGEYDRESGSYIVTEQDAHTWVEVYFPNYGWIEFEPTAGESILNRPSGVELPDNGEIPGAPEDLAQQQPQPQMDDPLMDNGFDPGTSDGGFFEEMVPQTGAEWAWWGVIVSVLAVAGVLLFLRRRLYQGPDDFEAELPDLFYERLLLWTSRIGAIFGSSHTPYERAKLLSRQIPGGEPFIQRITEIYVRHRFAPHRDSEANNGVDTELSQNWELLRPILIRTWVERRLRRVWPGKEKSQV